MATRFSDLSALFVLAGSAIFSAAQSLPPNKQATVKDDSKEAVVVEHLMTRAIFNVDGTGTRETEAVIKVQAQAGVQALAVLTFLYTSGKENVEIDHVRVRKPDAAIVTTPALNIQDMPGDVTRLAPVYSDIHEKHVTVKGLGVGDVLEYTVRYRIQRPDVPDQFWFEYSFEKNIVVKDEQLEISVPRDKYVNVTSPDIQSRIEEQASRRIYRWRTANLERREDSGVKKSVPDTMSPSVEVSTFRTWDNVGQWYRTLQAPHVIATAAIRSKVMELTKGLTSDQEKIRALYNFVATRFHYVSLSFGVGRYEPHSADQVLENEYGDCKDKHTLLAALLKGAGYDAWPALINTKRKITADVPSPGQFDHLITVVPRGNSIVWLDTTPEVAPFGLLLANLRDKDALVMPTDRAPGLMKTPKDPPFSSSQSFVAEGKLTANGTFKGRVERVLRGDAEVLFRAGFRGTSPAEWRDLVQQVSYASGFSGEVSDVSASAPEDTGKPFQFSYGYTREKYGDWPNHRITPPLPPLGIEGPDDADKPVEPVVLGAPGEIVYRAKVELPEGYTLKAPDKVDLSTDYAEYHAQYGFEKGVFTGVRRFVIKKSKVPLAEWDGYLKFRKAIGDDEGYWIDVANLNAKRSPTSPGVESEDADVLNGAGRVALDRHDDRLAADLLSKAVKINPQHKWAWNNLGLAYMGLGRLDEAASALRRQIEINPNDPYAYNNLGRLLEIQGRHDEARQAFQKQIVISPQDPWAHANLGGLLLREKKYDDAVGELERAVAISETDAGTVATLGKAYLEVGQLEKGMAALDKAVQMAPSPVLLNNVAYILAEKGQRLDKARQFAESAISSLNGLLRDIQLDDLKVQHLYFVNLLGMTWDTLGWVYFQQGNMQEAEKYLKAAWILNQDAAAGNHLGQLYEKQGKTEIAAQLYAQAVGALHSTAATRERLVAITGGEREATARADKARDEIQGLRTTTVQVPGGASHYASAEFFVSFLPGPKVDQVKFVSGDKELTKAVRSLASAKYNVVFPDREVTTIVRRGILACPRAGSTCKFVLMLPNDVRSVD